MSPWVYVPVVIIVLALAALARKLLTYPAQHAAPRPDRQPRTRQIRSPWAPSWPLPAVEAPAWYPHTLPAEAAAAELVAPRVAGGRLAELAPVMDATVASVQLGIGEQIARMYAELWSWAALAEPRPL